jgi:hypothetical protein
MMKALSKLSLILLITALSFPVLSLAQWVQTNGPYGLTVFSFAVSSNGMGGKNLFAGTYGRGIFLSTNNGIIWTAVNEGLTGLSNIEINALACAPDGAGGTNLFAGTLNGVVLSTNNGTSWTTLPTPILISSFAVTPNGAGGSDIFAGTGDNGIFRSTDNGMNWTAVDSGLPFGSVSCLTVSPNGSGGTNIFAGFDYQGVSLSTNNGISWTQVNTGLTNTHVVSLAAYSNGAGGTNLFAGTWNGGFLSTDNGKSWTEADSGLPKVIVFALTVSPDSSGNLFAGTGYGVYLSTNNGTSWTQMNSGLTNTHVRTFTAYPNGEGGMNLFAGIETGGVFLSTNNGTSWTPVNSGLTNDVTSLAVSPDGVGGTNLFAGTRRSSVYLSTNNGISWTDLNTEFFGATVNFITVAPNGTGGMNLFAGGTGVLLSTNNGTSWTNVNVSGSDIKSFVVSPTGAGGTNLFSGDNGVGVFLSTDYGTNWTAVNSGLTSTYVHTLVVSPDGGGGTKLFAATNDGVFFSTDNGTSWTASALTDRFVNSFAVFYNGAGDTNLIAGADDGYYFLSSNNGASWTAINSEFSKAGIMSFAVSPNRVGRGLPTGHTTRSVVDDSSSGTTLYAATHTGGVFLSTDNGISWTAFNSGLTNDVQCVAVSPDGASGTNLFAGTQTGGVWKRPLSEMILDTITASVGSNGSISPSGSVVVLQGRDVIFKITPSTGYHVDSVIVDGSYVGTDTIYTFTNVATNHTIRGVFRINQSLSTTNLTAFPGNGQVLLIWSKDNHPNFMRYRIYGNTMPHPITMIDSTNGEAADTAKVIHGLINGVTYYFRLTTVDSLGIERDSSNEVATKPSILISKPNLTAIPGDGQVLLHWGKNTEPDFLRYRVYGDSMPDPITVIDSTTEGGVTDTSKDIYGLINGTTYYFRITAVDSGGFESDYSNEVIVTPGTFVISVNDGWNMISIPLLVHDNTKDSVFPTSASCAITYQDGYIVSPTLAMGRGYWFVFHGTQMLSLTGSPVTFDSIDVAEGWNLIGSISSALSVNSITSFPPNMVTSRFFGYRNGYFNTDTIYPGEGYWVKVSQAGSLVLSLTSSSKTSVANRIRIVPTSELPPPAPSEQSQGGIAIPKVYGLEQAYPNPFNPTTTIQYQLPSDSRVSLKIFNLLGQVDATLVNQTETAGYKSVNWNASSFASGIYFYRLEATSVTNPSKAFTQVKKIVLMK